jgi:hypothetical protein
MAISGSTDFSISRDQLIEGALRICGALAPGETPTTTQYTWAAEALNMVVKAWQSDGMPLWAMSEYTITLVDATNTYTITPKLLKVTQALNRNSDSNIDIPMRIVSRDEYNRLGNKTSSGNPIILWANPNLDNTTVKVYPTPTTVEAGNNTLILTFQKEFSDFDASADTPEFPKEYYDAIKFALASRLSYEYGMDVQDRKQIFEQALILKNEALSFGTEEGSVFFGVETRRW